MPASRDPASLESNKKREMGWSQGHSHLGCLNPPDPDDFPCMCIFPSPRAVIWMDFLVCPLSSQFGILKREVFSNEALTFPFPVPLESWRGSRNVGKHSCPWRNSQLQCTTITIDLRFMKIKQYVPVSVPAVCLPMVQCSPFQPSRHSHFPSLQVPCSMQRGWHTRWSQAAPVQPSSQRQAPPMQTP